MATLEQKDKGDSRVKNMRVGVKSKRTKVQQAKVNEGIPMLLLIQTKLQNPSERNVTEHEILKFERKIKSELLLSNV